MDIKIQQDPALAQWIAKCFVSMVADSPNYTEMKFDLCGQYRGKFEWVTVHIQKGNGKTPHQMRQEVERERDELRARLNPPNAEVSERGSLASENTTGEPRASLH